jgi:hypothetical protein
MAFNRSYCDIHNFFSEKYGNGDQWEFDEHYWKAYYFLRGRQRKEAMAEFKQVKNPSWKEYVAMLCCTFPLLFKLLFWVRNDL